VRPYLEKSHHRKGEVAEGVGPEFKSQSHQRDKKKEKAWL
jgi:hypothetical protein